MSSELCLNFLVRKFTWAVHRCTSVPQLLDGTNFEFIDGPREKTPDVKKLLIPDYDEKSGLAHEKRWMSANLPRCDH